MIKFIAELKKRRAERLAREARAEEARRLQRIDEVASGIRDRKCVTGCQHPFAPEYGGWPCVINGKGLCRLRRSSHG